MTTSDQEQEGVGCRQQNPFLTLPLDPAARRRAAGDGENESGEAEGVEHDEVATEEPAPGEACNDDVG